MCAGGRGKRKEGDFEKRVLKKWGYFCGFFGRDF
jgi:hypothetical protein